MKEVGYNVKMRPLLRNSCTTKSRTSRLADICQERFRLSCCCCSYYPISVQQKMDRLLDLPLNDLDTMKLERAKWWWMHLVSAGHAEGGVVRHDVRVLNGVFTTETKGREEYCLYVVFVEKIRRECQGRVTDQVKRAWYSMANTFSEAFGENRTPPDILHAMQEVRGYLDRVENVSSN